jgi:hypothetical protein
MGLLSPYYGSTAFDGVGFWEQSQGQDTRPGRDILTDGTLYNIGGAYLYVDMGETAQTFDIVAGVEGAELTSLRAKRGVTGSLVWSRGTWTATLKDIRPQPGRAGNLDAYTVTLTFFSTSYPSGSIPGDGLLSDGGAYLTSDGGAYLTQG